MNYWEQREKELLAKENAYLDNLNWFEKIVDNDWFYTVFLLVASLIGFNIGFLIGIAL